jgi:MoaA/NifB/PqqE/SkfB family radical SAM enzyme
MLHPRPFAVGGRAVRAALDGTRPLLAQMVVTRRCNLACGYCNEYDDVSPPIDTDVLKRQIDHLASMGTLVVTLTGGEPLLHPDLDQIVRHAVDRGMVCTTISNAYPVTKRWIERLNAAGLSLIQISVDNLQPNDISSKSWSKIRPRLELLKAHAKFKVNINAVLGSCRPQETRALAKEVGELGFFMTVGLLHDGRGQLDPGLAGEELASLYEEMRDASHKSVFHRFGEGWEDDMIRDGKSDWKCRAGSRYLYIDEFGVVSYCSQRRGEPGIPLLQYTREHAKAAFETAKGCEAHCTIACVRRASSLDEWKPQNAAPNRPERSEVHLPIVTGA